MIRTQRTPRAVMTRRCFRWIAPAGILLLWGIGCSSQPPADLTVCCSADGKSFSQCFTQAYSTLGNNGDADVVLVCGSDGPVRQVMHIRVLWKPTRDSKADHDSARNATVHWYVMGQTAADIIEYDGTAMVVVEPDDHGATLSIRSALLRPVARRGSMRDPIGQTSIHGTIRTADDPDRVRKVLANLRASVVAARSVPGNITLRTHTESPSSSAQ
jgi:hypothetical protein